MPTTTKPGLVDQGYALPTTTTQAKATTTVPPVNPAFNDAEVKRKAEAGIPLLNQNNQAAMAAYNQHKQNFVNKRQAQNFAQVDPNQFKVQTATIDDIAKKYGFDFSREYANRQAEAEAQAKRNANADAQRRNTSNRDLNLKQIDNNLMSQAEGLDRNYFQQYQQQAQAQVNGGINGGIAADQDLRMAMARQAAMSDSYRDANLGRMQENQRFSNDDIRLAEDLGLINQQGLARAESLHQDRLMQGAGLAMETDRFNLNQNQGLMQASLQQRGQNIGIEQFLQEMDRIKGRDARSDFEFDTSFKEDQRQFNQNYDLNRDQFNWQQTTDARDFKEGVFQDRRDFSYGAGRDKVADSQWAQEFGLQKDKFDWSKYIDGENLKLSKADQANLKAQLAAGNPTAFQFIQQYTSAKKAQADTPLDKYYQNQEKIFGGSTSPYMQPVPPAQNPNLSPWDKMKLMGIGSNLSDFTKLKTPAW